MSGKHTIFDTRRIGLSDSRDISATPERPDHDLLDSSFVAERGLPPVKRPNPKLPRAA